MDVHANDWSDLADRLSNNYGGAFDPEQKKELRPKLVRVLTRELADVERERVVASLDNVLRRTKVTIDWQRFLCIILSSLPGSWTKLDEQPGLRREHDAAADRRHGDVPAGGRRQLEEADARRDGSYINGTWSDLAPMHWTRRYYASAVLTTAACSSPAASTSNAGSETNKTEIYDPVDRHVDGDRAAAGLERVGDAPCAVLPDGRVFVGHIDSTKTAIYDPVTDTWTAGPVKRVSSSEESWVLLPDDTVITVRCNSSQRADKYDAAGNTWVSGGTLPVNIIEVSSVGDRRRRAALRRTRVLRRRDRPHRALHAAGDRHRLPGTWTAGPDFPNDAVGPDRRLQGHAVVPVDERPACSWPRGPSTGRRTTGSRRRCSTCSTGAAR